MADSEFINKSELGWQQVLRDTEYSHPAFFEDGEPYVYHCGVDIFNNHRLRANDFVYIDNVNEEEESTTFNTLWDTVKDVDGYTVVETVSLVDSAETEVHVYSVDSVMSMEDAFANRIREENGWFGFINKTDIDIPNAVVNDEEISLNKVLNNNNACEFIDMYPDRSLFSFIPKVNKYRNRLEKNWDYCVTYPYQSDYERFNEVVDLQSDLAMDEGGNSIKVLNYKIVKSPAGNAMIRLKSMFKHTLTDNDYITLYYKIGGQLVECRRALKILSVGLSDGTETDRYFGIKYNDIAFDFNIEQSGDTKVLTYRGDGEFNGFYYKKNINGTDCHYYLRRFKKIKNEEGEELNSDVNKLAYGENIYGDRLAQVIFTDDIDVDGLLDNRGRPLTEIYFTIVKRNAGWEEWYQAGDLGNEDVEFSHCFGEITSGLDLPEEADDYNVRKIHNITDVDDVTKEALKLTDSPEALEYDIDINGGDEQDIFYGDIVEFNPLDYTETVLEVVQHRFNTAQREIVSNKFKNILYDRLQYDDYDAGIIEGEDGEMASGFTIVSGYCNQYNGEEFYGNLNPEGYFYNPFTRIKIREESELVSTVIGTTVKCSSMSNNSITTEINYEIMKGDALAFYNTVTKKTKWLTVKESNGVNIEFWTDEEDFIDGDIDDTIVVKTDECVPIYAQYIPSMHSFVWRGIREFSELSVNSDLYDMPFANGCFYIHDNVNLFLKRQDPNGEFGLLPTNLHNPLINYSIPGNPKIDTSSNRYFDFNKLGRICY